MDKDRKKIAILGSTGSIGLQTIDVVSRNPELEVVGLGAAGHHPDALEAQVRALRPRLAAVYDEAAARDLRVRLADTDCEVLAGMDGLIALAQLQEAELLVTAIVGMIGILPTLAAIRAGKDIALANKETLVTAGHLIIPLAQASGVSILPVDSEHSAIFQCLRSGSGKELQKLIITASGGPFRGRKADALRHVTKAEALAHPNWDMGAKITIDSATLVNKGLEVIEAKWLFGVPLEQIEVVVQPKSIIHSMVEFTDGAVIAQMGTPDMRLPIQYALFYPERRTLPGDRLDFSKLSEITFEPPDTDTFRGLPMAILASRAGGSMPTVFNAANEEAVALFLRDRIRFLDIYEIIQEAMDAHAVIPDPDIGTILETEQAVRASVRGRWGQGRSQGHHI